MSRTVRSLPVGSSKKYGVRGYYNTHFSGNFTPSAIHLLKRPEKKQVYAFASMRHGLWLDAPEPELPLRDRHRWRSKYTEPYAIEDFMPHETSISGPKWVDKADFDTPVVQGLILRGWTFNRKTERVWRGPEEWDVNHIDHGPDFRDSRVWLYNPDFDEDREERYCAWKAVHTLVCRNGHYKDRTQGHPIRKSKLLDHRLTRHRAKADLYRARVEWEIESLEDQSDGVGR